MAASETWQALQRQLSSAGASFEAGDFSAALAAAEAALAIDPACVAAQVCRDRIREQAKPNTSPDIGDSPIVPSSPIVSLEGWARFEQRARERRIQKRFEAARTAIARRRFDEARTALAEIQELDAGSPGLVSLESQVASGSSETHFHSGPALAAAVVFGVVVLASASFEKTSHLLSSSIVVNASAPTALPEVISDLYGAKYSVKVVGSIAEPLYLPVDLSELQQRSVADVNSTADRDNLPVPTLGVVSPVPAEATGTDSPSPTVAASPADEVPTQSRFAQEAAVMPPVRPPEAIALTGPAPVNDEDLVKQVLLRYRAAYAALDARSAQQVWPTVDEAALARAFDGLDAQDLTFTDCRVQLRGSGASARCIGSARYVPKVGNRQPRTEARVWNFELRKAGNAWQIASARAE